VLLLAYIVFQIAFVTAVVNFVSSFENNRYRLPIDPFFVALLGLAIERFLRRRVASKEGVPAMPLP